MSVQYKENVNLNPLNLPPLEFYTIKTKMEKIILFFQNYLPTEYQLFFTNYYFREAALDVMAKFSLPENITKDHRNYPWKTAILEKRKEKFGF